jgi:hypothetical protein
MKNETMTDTIRVGVQRNITDKNCPVESVPLLRVLEQMHASENLKAITTAIVKAQNKHEVDELKRTLPAVIISADTTHRKVHPDDVRTGLILMDIDSGDNPDMDIDEMRVVVEQMRRRYDYIIGFTLSATWRGLKVLCAVSKRADEHVRCFMALEEIFSQHGINVDRACKDLKRVNYVPHDPNVQETLIKHLADWSGAYIEPADPPKKRVQYRAPAISAGSDMTPDEEAQLCLQHMSPDMDYADWVSVGMALKSHGCSCATWDAWSAGAESYKQGECERKWNGFSGSGVGFGTVVKLATDGNGGKNPISAAKNQRERVDVANDFDDVTDESCDLINVSCDLIDESVPMLSKENTYYHNSKYYILDASGKRYIQLNGDGLTRQLRMIGYSPKGADGEMSQVDKFKAYVELNNTVDATGALAGRSIGLRDNEGTSMSYLVTRKNSRTVGVEGKWDNLRAILEAQYGSEQLDYLFSWLHRSRYQLDKEEFMQGHALAISGKVGGGKSLIIINVIKPLLGQLADAYQYLCKDNQFNGDLISAEMLLIDDKPLSRRMEERKIFGNQIKSVVATSSDVRCHRKGVDGFNVNPLWRIVIAINDTEQDLGAMPPLGEGQEDTIGDKVLMLKCFPSKLPFTGDKDQFAKLKALIKSEIQAFAYFIDNYTIPASIKKGDCRFGFDAYHHPDLLDVLNQNSNERTLLSVTTEVLFNDEFRVDVLTCATTGRQYWEGSAKEWSHALLSSKDISYRVKGTVEGMLAFGDSAQKAGKKIKDMAAISGGRVVFKGHTKRGNIWRVWDDNELEIDDENEPF